MRILFLISSLRSGGAERVAQVLCNAWAARGDSVEVISTYSGGGTSFYDFHPSVSVRFLADMVRRRGLEPQYVARLRTLALLVRDVAPDVIVSFLSNVNATAVVARLGTGVPLVISERSDPEHMPMSRPLRWACNLTYPHADALVVQTRSVHDKVGDFFRLPKTVITIPNPLPDGVVKLERPAYGYSTPRRTLISLGRLSPEKQVPTMVEAFSALAHRYPEWDYVLYGDGPLRAEYQALIDAKGLTTRVFLKGTTATPWAILSKADAFVMASRFEGFPNALLEAMGLGLPCVVFDCESGPREITRDGRDALLVPLNDQAGLQAALERVMSDPELRRSLGQSARQSVVDRYQLSTVLANWDAVFRQVGALA